MGATCAASYGRSGSPRDDKERDTLLTTKKSEPTPMGASLLCLEMCLDKQRQPTAVCAVFSVVGGESTLTLSWPLLNGRIDANVLADLLAKIDQQITLSIDILIGVQGVMPLG